MTEKNIRQNVQFAQEEVPVSKIQIKHSPRNEKIPEKNISIQFVHEDMSVSKTTIKQCTQPVKISEPNIILIGGVPLKKFILIVLITAIVSGITVFLPTYYLTKSTKDSSPPQEIPPFLKAELPNNTFEECNNSLIGNTTLALNYANGTYTTVQDPGGSLDKAINSLFIVRKEWTPSKAVCGNYPLSTILTLNLNSSSCTGCVIAQGTCSKCTDKLIANNIGSKCMGCVINGVIGICGACQTCTPISITAKCTSYQSQTTSITLDGISCSGCSGTTCSTCLDKTNTGSVGSLCSNCTSQNGIGYCKSCQICTKNYAYANCQNQQNSFQQLGLLYNSCYGCVNGICSVCIDSSKNGNKGNFCTQCTHTGVDVGYCTQCAICTPVKVLSNCLNMKQYLNLNESSCQKCSKIGPTASCEICYDKKANSINGTYCRQCWITNSTDKTGYCNECQICSNVQVSAVCSNQQGGRLSLIGNSCRNCLARGSSITCDTCTDRFKINKKGTMCEYCTLTGLNSGYCLSCKICSYTTIEAQCQFGGLVQYLQLSSQLLCTGCYYLGGDGYCQSCTDKKLNGNKGSQCYGCTLFNNNQGICTRCRMCTPLFKNANCNNFVPLNLNETSCEKCKIMGSTTTCELCRDRILNNTGYNCSNCFITQQNKGYCLDCLTCSLSASGNKAMCSNSDSSFPYLNLDIKSCSGCSGSYCNLCIDKYNSQLKGYGCEYCTISGSTGYCRGSCRACVPVKTYTNCGNSWASFSRLALGELSCTGCSGTTCAQCTDVRGNGNKGYNCGGCTIVEGGKGFCSTSYSCSLCTPVKTYINSGFGLVDYIQLKEDSCSGCSGNTCANCTDMRNSSIVGYNCGGCTIFKADKGYCSPSYSCSVTVPVSTYTNCDGDQGSVIILKLNSTSCSQCVGTSCGKCTDYINGNIGYNCNGCVIVNGKLGYCLPNYYCSRCTPVITTATCSNYNNAYLYLNLNESSCSKCTGSTCGICLDKNNSTKKGTSCSSCTLVVGDTGYCNYCATCS